MNDKDLIKHHGGPAKLAELLGFTKSGGVQRVANWMRRGIPAKQKLERPDLFQIEMRKRDRRTGKDRRATKSAVP